MLVVHSGDVLLQSLYFLLSEANLLLGVAELPLEIVDFILAAGQLFLQAGDDFVVVFHMPPVLQFLPSSLSVHLLSLSPVLSLQVHYGILVLLIDLL